MRDSGLQHPFDYLEVGVAQIGQKLDIGQRCPLQPVGV
jgi:hypothetical protein